MTMNTLRKRWFVLATVVTLYAAIQPGRLSAQTSGVGTDGYTRVLWVGTDSSVGLWELNSSLSLVNSHAYGPYYSWIPVAISVGGDNYTRLLWVNTDGEVIVWLIDPNLNYVSYNSFGPFSGWTGQGLSTDPSDNSTRLIWKDTESTLGVWLLDSNLNLVTNVTFGPYFGYATKSADSATRLKPAAKPATPTTADQEAAAVMKRHTPSTPSLK